MRAFNLLKTGVTNVLFPERRFAFCHLQHSDKSEPLESSSAASHTKERDFSPRLQDINKPGNIGGAGSQGMAVSRLCGDSVFEWLRTSFTANIDGLFIEVSCLNLKSVGPFSGRPLQQCLFTAFNGLGVPAHCVDDVGDFTSDQQAGLAVGIGFVAGIFILKF